DRLDYSPKMLTELMLAADELTTVWQHATTRGGTQTHGNLFDPALQNEQFSKLEKLIRKELRGYREKFKDCPDGIIKDFPRDFTLKGWRVKLMKAGFQKPHIHSGGWISGVLYLKIPKQIEGNEGSIAFSLHGYDYRKERDDIPYKEHASSEGDLILFPSSLFHWTIPFESDEERQCIAFDVVPA
ncbi:MAG: putative 2OG-Fe(II) oxygenase, partial [Pseudomonadota bacterium]